MAIHNATKLVPLSSQTKLTVSITETLTLNLTLTIYLTVTVGLTRTIIFLHTLLTPVRRFLGIYKRIFFKEVHSRICGWGE